MRHLTVHEAAEALQLSVPTIKRYIYDGKLSSTKLPGGQHRIPETEIGRLLALQAAGERLPAPATEAAVSAEERLAVLERWLTDQEAEIERLTAALEVISRYCARQGDTERSPDTPRPAPQSHRLAVLGPGCRRCNALCDLLIRVLKADGRDDIVVERVNDLDAIAAYGPILTPALLINNTIVLSGKVPSEMAVRELLSRHLA